MGKRKHKSRGNQNMAAKSKDKLESAAVKHVKVENPFEIRVNKRRYDILGRKTKHDKGRPGVARSKGLKKREKTLLVEYKHRHKANTFVDKRFGEYDEDLSLEEKMLKRFATEKQKHHEKAGLFNLEDEELTHFGQSLGDLKQFGDPRLSDEESDNNDPVDNANFGGFLKKRTPDDKETNNEVRSKKEIMEEVVANAKLKKHERQVLKEESETLRQQLDEELDDIRGLLTFRVDATGSEPVVKGDDYDKSVREMAFEIKAQASDKMKSEEQLAKQEQEKLKILEAERLRRMKGLPTHKPKPTHRSADDLDDGFILDIDKRSMLHYKDGKMVMPDGYVSDEQSAGEERQENSDEDDNDEDDMKEEGDSDESDDNSDLQSSDNNYASDSDAKSSVDKPDDNHSCAPMTKKVSRTGKDNIPYTFSAPKNFEDFLKLVENRSTEDQLIIIDRIRKCNHPKLNPANKVRMECFFNILIKFVGKISSKTAQDLSVVDGLVSHLFELTQHSPVHAAKTMQETLKVLQKQFCVMTKKKRSPSLEMVLHLRIISLLFPTSDLRHGVCTPALLFMSQVLSQMNIHTVQDILKGLFLCSLVYEFVNVSKRYVPEVINYFIGILYLASEKVQPSAGKVFLPFKTSSQNRNILKCSSKIPDSNDCGTVSISKMFNAGFEEHDNDRTKVHAIRTCLVLLKRFISLYSELASFPEIFEPVVHHMERIKMSTYPPEVQSLIREILQTITSQTKPRQPLALQVHRPKPIQTFEPKFEERYEVNRKRKSVNKDINERQKLRYKHKKEFKGAMREIRKDSQFLARKQLEEQMKRDAERSAKTKQIQMLLSNQQAEANEFNRMKRKLKKS